MSILLNSKGDRSIGLSDGFSGHFGHYDKNRGNIGSSHDDGHGNTWDYDQSGRNKGSI